MDEDDEDDDDEDDEEMEAKTSDASGSPASSNNNSGNKNKRQRSNTPPPMAHSATSSSSLDVKMQLTTNLLYLNGTDLGHVMSLLEQHCPNVLETCNNSNSTSSKAFPIPECMEINMDLLMDEYYSIFTMIQQYCTDHIVKKRFAASAQSGNVIKIKDISNRRKDRKT